MVTYRELPTRVIRNTSDGRGARAIALQCRADGVKLTDEEAQGLVDSYYQMYPGVRDFLNKCKTALEPGGPGMIHHFHQTYRKSVTIFAVRIE